MVFSSKRTAEIPDAMSNREEWLSELARRTEPLFVGFAVAPYRVTCGWPSSGGLSRRRVVGECHGSASSRDGKFELFISPVLDDPAEVAGTLAHEMAHVVAGIKAQHGKEFVAVCVAVGLTKGSPRQVMPGEELAYNLSRIVERLGKYPHAAIVPIMVAKPKKPPTSISLGCAACGCKVRMAVRWVATSGVPTCGCGTEMTLSE